MPMMSSPLSMYVNCIRLMCLESNVFLKNLFYKTCKLFVTQTAVLASGMMDQLDQPGHYTLFAPTNRAFDKLSSGYVERIMGDKAVISGMLYMMHYDALLTRITLLRKGLFMYLW